MITVKSLSVSERTPRPFRRAGFVWFLVAAVLGFCVPAGATQIIGLVSTKVTSINKQQTPVIPSTVPCFNDQGHIVSCNSQK